ncbi:hypothetical protein [Thalassotalea euphylliae]|uniref:Uncharacterized protein n=1 Tax=Thalassotalea euphylliae TaxID=1655234 RepID=A0A3E0UDN9_9GAMM|nr:hypothetical protein [Thalassotalea euphylliae]REL34683.1 hypothetical protein DXX92_04545 [Thalassotalea euphylliae]
MNEKEIELEKLKLNVEAWKTTVDVQKHFNDLEMKVRNFGLLIISAFISAIGVSLKSNYEVTLLESSIPVGSLIAFVAFFVWNLVFFVDVYWYHPLLKGAVLKGIAIEKEIQKDLPEIGLTQAIGESSSIKFLWWKELRSTTKAKIFYNGVSIALIVIAISLAFFTGNDQPISQQGDNRPKPHDTDKHIISLIKETKDLNRIIIELSTQQQDQCPKERCSTQDIQKEILKLNRNIEEHLDRHLILIKKVVKN